MSEHSYIANVLREECIGADYYGLHEALAELLRRVKGKRITNAELATLILNFLDIPQYPDREAGDTEIDYSDWCEEMKNTNFSWSPPEVDATAAKNFLDSIASSGGGTGVETKPDELLVYLRNVSLSGDSTGMTTAELSVIPDIDANSVGMLQILMSSRRIAIRSLD